MLLLPAVCALCSLAVGFICWRRGTLRWPQGWWERTSLKIDLVLTGAYLAAWMLVGSGVLSRAQKEDADIAVLVAGNLSTVVAFVPILAGTWRAPGGEHPLPWAIWSLAYLALGAATLASPGWTWYLLIYPVLCLALHLAMAGLAARRRGATARYEMFLDPVGQHVIWDRVRREPAMLDGELLAFRYGRHAAIALRSLNAGERGR